MSNPIWHDKDLGPVDAYALAVAGGYTGTKEEWIAEIANASTNAQTASTKANEAAGSAEDAEAWANGTRGGEDVDSDDPAYNKNGKYWEGQAKLQKEAAQAAAETASAAYNVNLLAPNYDSTATYKVGDHAIYSGGYYECISPISTPEAWTAAHWRQQTVGGETTDLKSALIPYSKEVSKAVNIRENISSSVVAGKYPSVGGDTLHIADNSGRGYISASVLPGHKYAVYPSFATGFSYFGELGSETYALVSDYTSNGIITVPDGFYTMYLSNTGWQAEGFTVVVIESDYKIDGYTTDVYPLGTVEKVDIPKLFDLKDTRNIVGIYHLRNWIRGDLNMTAGNPIPSLNQSSSNMQKRIASEPNNLIDINSGDKIIIASDFVAYVSIYNNSAWEEKGWITGEYIAPKTGKCAFTVRYSDSRVITDNDAIMDAITIYRIGNIREKATDDAKSLVKASFSALGAEQYDMVIGNYWLQNNNPVPNESTYLNDRMAIPPLGTPLKLNIGDKIIVDDTSLSYSYAYYNTTSKEWTESDWITGGTDTTITIASDYYYIKIRKTDNSAINSIKDLVDYYCIIRSGDYAYVNNRISRNQSRIDDAFEILEGVGGALLQLPDYYHEDDWIEDKVDTVKTKSEIINGVCFQFLTDVHFNSNSQQSKYLLKGIMESTTIPLVICGGDIPSLTGTEDDLISQVQTLVDYQNYIGKDRFFAIRGNHDFYCGSGNSRVTLTEKQTYNPLLRNCERETVYMLTDHMCYVIEDNAQNTVYLMMNSKDSNSQESYISGEQAKWIADELLKYKDKYIIAVSHIPSDDELEGYSSAQEIIQTLLAAFNARSTVSTTHNGTAISADYSTATGKIVFHLSGHDHKDESNFDDGILSIVTTCDAHYQDDGYDAEVGTVTEQAFDVFCVDYDAKTISAVRIGRGNDRTWDISSILS